MTLPAGARLGPYEIQGLVGAGGMGEVYRARDPRLGREVAVKVLPAEVASDSARLSLFEREARAVAALNHPNILTVHDVGTHDGTLYVVTELLEGETLRELVSRRTPTTQQILTYMLQAARGLEAAHAKGVVHRDLKPENLFLTTDGRVKVLDFGLAKLHVALAASEADRESPTATRDTSPGVLRGTVGYMSPEQARAQAIDARADVFSLGVVLYELLAGKHPFKKKTLAGTLTAIVEETPPDLESLSRAVPPSVGGIVRRCLEKERDERYASGHDVVVALEAVLAAPSSAAALREVEERSPYPGLSAFTEKDATVFFGREREIEELWARVRSRHLLAVIGPSGVGKSSFVRAGVLPSRPDGWVALVCTPGNAPMAGLGRALTPELAGDLDALQELPRFEDPEVAFDLLGRWHRGHGEALLVVDQLEELFTLNPTEVQQRFAALLGRLAREGDIHVVLSLRDDFLMRCHDHEALAPVFTELTPLGALTPQALERSLREPARKRGYRFEDEALVEEMVSAVEGARAALPLLAFAVSRLWETRDREEKVLTRTAYEEIGGVAGALAQHAEATMDRIGPERQGVVREVFRNLVTAQGTRAVMDREELLSAFPDRPAAEGVLGQLIDARLVTSYEVEVAEGEVSHHRVEVAHESLLKAWPRLVRWQTQDEDGAQLRDQLKQAAHLWEEKERSPDVLWSGAAYREFELWHSRYPGRLTAVEEGFARAMVERVKRRGRLRRGAVALGFLLLALVAVAIGVSRHEAVQQAQRAERESRVALANQLVALGRNHLQEDPTAALAFARRSLEIADTAGARLLTLEALWKGPPGRFLSLEGMPQFANLALSPDGRWLATENDQGKLLVFEDAGGAPRVLRHQEDASVGSFPQLAFAPDGRALATWRPDELAFWSVPDGEARGAFDLPGEVLLLGRAGRLFTLSRSPDGPRDFSINEWSWSGEGSAELGRLSLPPVECDLDPTATWMTCPRGTSIAVMPFTSSSEPERVFPGHESPLTSLAFSADGSLLASLDQSGEARVWSFQEGSPILARVLRSQGSQGDRRLRLGPGGRRLAWIKRGATVQVWDLEDPPDVSPAVLRRPGYDFLGDVVFGPLGRWLAVSHWAELALWPLGLPHSRLLPGHTGSPIYQIAFTPDSRWLVSCAFEDRVRAWPLRPEDGQGREIGSGEVSYGLAVDPDSRKVLAGWFNLEVVPVDGVGEPRRLPSARPGGAYLGRSFDPTGRYVVAAAGWAPNPEDKVLRVWDLETDETRFLPLPDAGDGSSPYQGHLNRLEFTPDGTLYSSGMGPVRRWDLESGSSEVFYDARVSEIDLSGDGRFLLVGASQQGGATSSVADTGKVLDELLLFDLESGRSHRIDTHGSSVQTLALGSEGRVIATGDGEGLVRVGLATGEEPHLLPGHQGYVSAVALSPDGRWVASAAGTEIRLWPVPDLSKPPLHTLLHDELVNRLRSFTNLEVVEDETTPSGYRLEIGPFPGWKEVPEW